MKGRFPRFERGWGRSCLRLSSRGISARVIEICGFCTTHAFRNHVFLATLLVLVIEIFIWCDSILADAGWWMEAKTFLDYGVLKQDMISKIYIVLSNLKIPTRYGNVST